MVKFEGFDEKGYVIHSEFPKHLYAELPMKGLGKSLDNVGIHENVIITQTEVLNGLIFWNFTKAEIERRALELGAEINWKQMPAINAGDEHKLYLWFHK